MLTKVVNLIRSAPVPRWAWLGLVFVCASGIGLAAGAWKNLCADCPSIARIYTYEPRQTSKVYASDSTLIAEFGDQRRTLVSIHTLPPYVAQAFIAIEDRRFYSHNGLDLRGIGRAALGVLRTGSLSGAGGSTITQQLARHMWTDRIGFEKRLVRKMKEWQVAMELERAYTKDQILEAYMNQIGYAHGWYGLQRASQSYFGKNAADMNPAEAALLAAIANLPERYSPLNNPDAALRRRNLVLTQMADQGYLTGEEAARWKGEPVPTERANRIETQAPYFVEWVRRIVADRFGRKVNSGGLEIYTTLDLGMQAAAQTAMEAGWERIEAWPGYDHPTYAEFMDANDGADVSEIPYVQGMFVAVEPATGHVRALIGGRDFLHSEFDRATQARRQAGSSFKPFVYAAALESGIPASEVFLDAPIVLPQVDGTLWRPSNYDPEFRGWITMREAMAASINTVAVKVGACEVGLESVARMAQRLGIRTEVERFPSTAIGAAEVVPIQMVEAYATLSNLGTRVRPFPVLEVVSPQGEVLWRPNPERTREIDPLVARVAVSMLEEVVRSGTGYTGIRVTAGLPHEVPAAGKSGTTNEWSNVWYLGFTPNLAAGVWFGMDTPVSIVARATGGGLASPVWGEFMRRVYYGDDGGTEGTVAGVETVAGAGRGPLLEIPEPWTVHSGLTRLRVDRETGLLASRWCPADDAYEELYLPGTEPTAPCDRQARRAPVLTNSNPTGLPNDCRG